jgi:hypothetical protein
MPDFLWNQLQDLDCESKSKLWNQPIPEQCFGVLADFVRCLDDLKISWCSSSPAFHRYRLIPIDCWEFSVYQCRRDLQGLQTGIRLQANNRANRLKGAELELVITMNLTWYICARCIIQPQEQFSRTVPENRHSCSFCSVGTVFIQLTLKILPYSYSDQMSGNSFLSYDTEGDCAIHIRETQLSIVSFATGQSTCAWVAPTFLQVSSSCKASTVQTQDSTDYWLPTSWQSQIDEEFISDKRNCSEALIRCMILVDMAARSLALRSIGPSLHASSWQLVSESSHIPAVRRIRIRKVSRLFCLKDCKL